MRTKPWLAWYPDDVEHEIEIPKKSLFTMLEESAFQSPQKEAVIEEDVRWTYGTLYQKVIDLADSLEKLGFKEGDRAALLFLNTKEYIVTYFALLYAGGTVIQVNPLYTSAETTGIFKDAEPEWAFGTADQELKIAEASAGLRTKCIISKRSTADFGSLESLIEKGKGPLSNPPVYNPDTKTAVLQYTGGTTGLPKAVMLTHQNIFSNIYQNVHFTVKNISRKKEKLLGVSPFYHVYGMTAVLLLGIFRGSAVICIPRYQTESFLHLIKKEKPTLFSAVPTVYIAMLQHPLAVPETMQSLKLCMCGSAPMPIDVMEQFQNKTGAIILEGYGLSETSPTTHRNPASGKRKIGSIGIPIPNTDCMIVSQEDEKTEVVPGEVGELLIKGPQVMKGYWNRPEETNHALRNGWLYTGDLARMDEDGYFYIVGRKKELIIASGYNIYPVEVEQVLYTHSQIKEAVVFGVPDTYRGETVYAAVTLTKDAQTTPEELREWLKEYVAVYKVPAKIEIRDSLPRTSVGKILRRRLSEEKQNR